MAAKRWPLVVRSLRLCASSSANLRRTNKSGSGWGARIGGVVEEGSHAAASWAKFVERRGLTGQVANLKQGGAGLRNKDFGQGRGMLPWQGSKPPRPSERKGA